MRGRDRAIGIILGVAVGIAIVAVFVFEFSDETIDAPSLSGGEEATPPSPSGDGNGAVREAVAIATASPESGGPEVTVKRGQRVVLGVNSDAAREVELLGLGIVRTVPRGRSTIAFRAARRGEYPLIASASRIALARVRVE